MHISQALETVLVDSHTINFENLSDILNLDL